MAISSNGISHGPGAMGTQATALQLSSFPAIRSRTHWSHGDLVWYRRSAASHTRRLASTFMNATNTPIFFPLDQFKPATVPRSISNCSVGGGPHDMQTLVESIWVAPDQPT